MIIGVVGKMEQEGKLDDKTVVNDADLEKLSQEQNLADRLGDAHVNILPLKKLLISFAAMATALFIAFADQTSVTIGLASIAKDLHAETTINWAGTASLLANTVCQVLFGRFADIFGRKNMLLGSLALLGIANLGCGFVRTGVQYYILRAFSGIGAGGIQSISMTIVSDIVTLKQRGKFQGILGSTIGISNAFSPLIMAGFIEHSTWRNFYRLTPPLCAIIFITVYFLIEDRKKELNQILTMRQKFKKIDYLGVVMSSAALTLLLIPISGGGSTYSWNSKIIIIFFCLGGVSLITFLFIEWKIPELPMIPLRLFKTPSLSFLLLTNFFFGMTYYGFIYYTPYYYQLVRGFSIIRSAILMFPLVLPMAISSILAGAYMSWCGHYIVVIYAGFSLWLLGNCLLLTWNENSSIVDITIVLIIMGFGVGSVFQPSMVACQAQSRKADRAVVISTRNVIRSFGGAVGIAICSLIMTNTLITQVDNELQNENSILSKNFLNYIKQNIYSRADLSNLNQQQLKLIRSMYMKSLRNVYYLLIPLIAICLLACIPIKDKGMSCIDEISIKEDENRSKWKNFILK